MDGLSLYPNKNVKIIKNPNNYTVLCLKWEITPGAYSIFNVEKQKWYTIEICCKKFGNGNPGLWIALPDKKTLFYGNYFTTYNKKYIKRSFFTGDYNKILVGILIKSATNNSGFILERLVVNERSVNDEKIKEPISLDLKNTLSDTYSFNRSNKIIELNNYIKPRKYYLNICNSLMKKLKELIKEINKPNFENNLLKILDFEKNKMVIENILNEINSENEVNNNIYENEVNNNIYENEVNNNIYENNENLIYCIEKKYGNIDIRTDIFTCSINKLQVYPISLGIPKEHVLTKVPYKTVDFFKYISDKQILNNYKNSQDFYNDLEKSRFILISNYEFGKDNPIYYEALARGCIPIFVNELNKYTSPFLPKEVLKNIKNTKGVCLGWVESNNVSYSEINKLAKHLMHYTKDYLTTVSIVDYVLNVININVRNVLFLSNSVEPDDFLLQQSLMHGFKKKLGYTNVVDYPKLSNMYKNITYEPQYRMGIPYYNTLEESNISRGRLEKRIENKEFDLIIVMGIFSEKDRKRLRLNKGDFPFKNIINEYYVSNEICFIDGNSSSSNKEIEDRLIPYSNDGIIFCKDFV